MSEVLRVLGQVAPAAATDTTLYTVPAARALVSSRLNICNRAGVAGTFRVAVRPAGAAIVNAHFLLFDVSLAANSTYFDPPGITMAATDVITVRASTADFTFQLFGSEVVV